MRPIHQTFKRITDKAKKKVSSSRNITLSDFFPRGTVYFYGYPSGEDSGFLNLVTPEIEEIVAARVNTCMGNNLKVMNFYSTNPNSFNVDIYDRLNLTKNRSKNIFVMPESISEKITGAERNRMIKNYIKSTIPEGSLIMAQPFNDQEIVKYFQIKPETTIWLNDKKHMQIYVDNHFLPASYGVYSSGKELAENKSLLKVPLVIKVSSSSAGDGVYLCRDLAKLVDTLGKLKNYAGSITTEQFIETKKNCGVQFGIKKDTGEVYILAISEQITTEDGEFLGGIVNKNQSIYDAIQPAIYHLKNKILPYAYSKNWYGVGCFDILIDLNDKPYFIDANFRMTGMTAGIFHLLNSNEKASLCTFTGTFTGSRNEFIKNVVDLANKENGWLNILSLSQNDDVWRFNLSFFYNNNAELTRKCRILRDNGVVSKIFEYNHLIKDSR